MGGEDAREAFSLPPEEILGKIFHFTAELGLRRFPHGFGELEECGLRRGVGGHGYNGMSPVRGDDRCGIERDRAEEVQPFLFGEGFAATLLEEIDLLTAMGTEEAAHVLHKAEHHTISTGEDFTAVSAATIAIPAGPAQMKPKALPSGASKIW